MKRALIFLHKWLGVALALLFLIWFASGIVLYYVPFPGLTQAERLAGLVPLNPGAGCCLTAQQAAQRNGLGAGDARLGMLAGAPVWRLAEKTPAARWIAVDAASGRLLPPLSDAAARAEAEVFSGRRALRSELLQRDQWTVPQGLNRYRPLLRVELDGDDGLELYVSQQSGEVVADTRRAERFWNWLGAVPHWIYFTELRRWPESWHNVVLALSLPGVLLAASGLALGIWQLYLNRTRWIPYRKFWMRWHHILGLAAAVVSLTWIFSGLLSMNPFGVFTARGATPAELQAWAGEAASAQLNPAEALRLAAPLRVRELDVLQLNGHAWYRLRGEDGGAAAQRLLRADTAEPVALAAVPEAELKATLLRLRHGETAELPTLTRLDHYDELYYARQTNANTRHSRPLPVWQASWSDGVTVYADAASAKLLLRADPSTRWQRLLYNGLHSFDFAPLLARPWLRGTLIVLLSLLGLAMSATACVLAWRVLAGPRRSKAATKR